jgi:two-component system, LytTR family, response regulator
LIRAVIVDDEPPSLKRLIKQLESSGMAKVEGAFTDPLEALAFLGENKLDAVFLDIEMPDMDGMELASRILDSQKNIAVVFVTAYNEYAVEAFRLNALDYFLKPVSADRLHETLCRIIDEKDILVQSVPVAVKCFGKFCVKAGVEEIKFRTEKAEQLLAYLIGYRGHFVSRSKIIDSLWEDFEGDRAIVNFNTTLHNVKKALLPYGIHISILYDRGHYRLETEGMACDYLQFCSHRLAGEVDAKNILEYEETASLYSGEYLSGWDNSWVGEKRMFLEEQFMELLLGIARYYKEVEDYGKAAKWLKTGFKHAPLHRELNLQLIETLLLSNEQMQAFKYYDLYRTGILKKLKAEPDAAFEKLMK